MIEVSKKEIQGTTGILCVNKLICNLKRVSILERFQFRLYKLASPLEDRLSKVTCTVTDLGNSILILAS